MSRKVRNATDDRAGSCLHGFHVKALPLILRIVENNRGTAITLAKRRPVDNAESGAQQHLFHSRPVVSELMFVTLPEIQVHNLHWRTFAIAAAFNQFLWRLEIASQRKLTVRHHDSKTAAGPENAMNFASDFLSIFASEVLHYVFAEDAVKRGVVKRKRLGKVQEILNILVGKSVHVYPMRIFETAWTRAQVEKQRSFQLRSTATNPGFLPGKRIPDPESKEVQVPTCDSQEAMTEKPEEKVTQGERCEPGIRSANGSVPIRGAGPAKRQTASSGAVRS